MTAGHARTAHGARPEPRLLRALVAIVVSVLMLGLASAPARATATLPTADPVAAAAAPGEVSGLWTVTATGAVVPRFGVEDVGTLAGLPFNAPVVGAAATATGDGLWVLGGDGGIFTLGDARFLGSTGGLVLNEPVVGLAAERSGLGYWLVASDGGIFSFGTAPFFGSMGDITLNQPVVGIAPTPTGLGYWLVAADGGVFAFGDAEFFGSTGGMVLNSPIVAIVPSPGGNGYWLLASDGGVFAFGDAVFRGSLGATPGFAAVALTPFGDGYAIVGADGAVHQVTSTFLDPAAPPAVGPHAFLNAGPDGRPVRWDPCTPIRYATNMTLAPPYAKDLLDEAVARVEGSTGLDLRFVGEASESFGATPPAGADAVVVFTTPALSGGLLDGFALGLGGLGGVLTSLGGRATVGFVLVDASKATSNGFSAVDGLGTLLQHELGHMVGLGHVGSLGQVMFPTLGSASDWGPGDREGLWSVGAPQGCLPSIAPSSAATGIVFDS